MKELPDTSVRFHSAVPTFLVSDIAATAEWYTDHLGFQLAGAVPTEEPYFFASLMRGPAEIMLLSLEGYERPPRPNRTGGLWDAYIRCDGVRALYQTVEGQPFVHMQLTQQPYGDWEFEIVDPNGYVLVFGGKEA